MNYLDFIETMRALPHFREFGCVKCGTRHRVHILAWGFDCVKCKIRHKTRREGSIGTEIQDAIDAVLAWAEKEEGKDEVQRILAWRAKMNEEEPDEDPPARGGGAAQSRSR
jgi:hypothetical protein